MTVDSIKSLQIHCLRLEIAAVTINMSGRGVLGVTPKYKIDMVETFLKSSPDLIFLQVCYLELVIKPMLI